MFLVVVLTVLGAIAYTIVPASIFPTMSFARIDVVANAGDLPPERVRITVAQPLERAFAGLPSVTRTLATSAQGSAEVVVTFDPSTNVQADLQLVEQAIASTRAQLPPDVNTDATIITANSEPIVSYALRSPNLSQTVVREMVAVNLVPQFSGTPGLARVLAIGGPPREYHIDLQPAALASHGLTAGDVTRALADATDVVSPGTVDAYGQRNALLVDGRTTDALALAQITVPDQQHNPIPIRALGTIRLGVAPATNAVSYDANPSVTLNFYGLPGADTVKMADTIGQHMKALEPQLPAGTQVVKSWDQTQLIRESQASLRDAIALGALLAVIVIFLFLRNFRMTLVAALVIPIAIALTIFTIGQLHQTLNLMTVGGLAVAVGLIIDDAIVVIENIARNLTTYPDESKRTVVARSMSELVVPMSASTITTVVVFIPLFLLSGVSGFFFRALATTLGVSLVISLGLAIFVTPIFSYRLIRSHAAEHEQTEAVARTRDRYESLLRWALSHRLAIAVSSAAVLLVTIVLLTRLPSSFLPALDEGQFEISYQLPPGATLQASNEAATTMERIAMNDPAVVSVARLTGIDTNGFSPTPMRSGTIRIILKPHNARPSYETVSGRLRDQMQDAVPAATLDFHQILEDMINDVSGAPSPLEIVVHGPDQATLISTAGAIGDSISKIPGVQDVFPGVNYDDPTVRIAPDGARLAALGVSANDVTNALSAATLGVVATSLPAPTMLVPVRVRVTPADPTAQLRMLNLPSGVVNLSTLARVVPSGVSSDTTEENGARVMIVTAGLGSRSLSSVISDVRSTLGRMQMPAGYTWSIAGEYQAQQQSFREFATVVLAAIVLVFFVMLITFQSFRLPLVILTAIPLALIGVALGLFLTNTPFNVSSFMGLLLLVGLIVKNGILLIDVANRRRAEGSSIEDALVTAGRLRLRPILMTTLAAIGGLLPLAIGMGSGAEMERPLAIAVIGGLSTATAFTLIAIPVLYAAFAGNERHA